MPFFSLNNILQAEQCSAVFPDGAQNNNNSGSITLGWQTKVTNSPDNILDSNNSIIDNSGGNSCGLADCVSSGYITQGVNVNEFGDGINGDVVLGYQEERTITPGNYKKN